MTPEIRFAARTDVGKVRERNEDNYLIDPKLGLFVVADGMGGHLGGQVASALAVNVVRRILRRHTAELEACAADPSDEHRQAVRDLLSGAVLAANGLVLKKSRETPELSGMGTTLTLLMLVGGHGFVAHVGDSRLYLIRQGRVQLISEDHTLLNALIKQGRIKSMAQVRKRFKNAVTRAVGVMAKLEVDVADFETLRGDRFLLCSDGLYDSLDGPRLARFLEPLLGDAPDPIVDELVAQALEAGGRDNITALWIEVGGQEHEARLPDRTERVRLLRDAPLFEDVSLDAIGGLLDACEEVVLERGDPLYLTGETVSKVHILTVGRVGIFREQAQVDSVRVGTVHGAELILEEAPRSADATALTDCRVLAMPREALVGPIEACTPVGITLARNLARVLARDLQFRGTALLNLRAYLAERESTGSWNLMAVEDEEVAVEEVSEHIDYDVPALDELVFDTLPQLKVRHVDEPDDEDDDDDAPPYVVADDDEVTDPTKKV